MTATLSCPKCKAPLENTFVNTGTSEPCPGCHAGFEVELFPAFFQKKESAGHEKILDGTEASCFYHEQNKASVVCESCGRFICALCDVEFKSQHLCPSCLQTGVSKGKIKDLQTKRVLYDNIALGLALLPVLIFWATFITAPLSLYYAITGWKKPGSLIPRTKIRFIIAMVVASAQIIGWCVVLFMMFFSNGG